MAILFNYIRLPLIVWTLILGSGLVLGDCGGRDKGKEIVEVLMWSGGSWAGFMHGEMFRAPNYLGHDVNKTAWNCPVDCRYTGDKSRVGNVDAVIFEAQPITSYYDAYRWSPPQFPQKFPYQKWINHGYETHIYFNLYGDPGYMNFIDINMTFYLHSQVPITFTCLWGGGDKSDFLKPPPPKYKDKCVIFMTTNCQSGGAVHRTAYAKDLMNYMQVDSYGKCLHNKDFPPEMQFPIYSDHGASMRNKIFIFKDYKFVLCFENNNVTDYVTEKMPNVLQAGSVPVYMGSSNVHPYWSPGENSIVRTDDFSGPKELAEYLQYMCDNDEEYYKLFEWKKKGLSSYFEQRLSDCAFYGVECRLCQYLLEQRNKLSEEQKNKLTERRGHHHQYWAVRFNGANSWITINASPKINVEKEFTLSAWVKVNRLDRTILDRDGLYTLKLRKTYSRFFPELCVKGECYLGSHPVESDSWHHIAVTYNFDQKAVRFYSNGQADLNIEIPTIHLTSEDYLRNPPFTIASDSQHSSIFDGLMDDVSIWNRAIDEEHGKHIIWDVMSGIEPGIVGYWSFNHAKGQVIDVAGNQEPGIVNGDTEWFEMLTKPLVTVSPAL